MKQSLVNALEDSFRVGRCEGGMYYLGNGMWGSKEMYDKFNEELIRLVTESLAEPPLKKVKKPIRQQGSKYHK